MIWFVLAAVGELIGCYALWVWLRDGRSPLFIPLAMASLVFFAWCLSRTPVQVPGRAFAARQDPASPRSIALDWTCWSHSSSDCACP